MHTPLRIERLLAGQPLIAPQGEEWESGVTFNAATTFLEPVPENVAACRALLDGHDFGDYPDGLVVLHYRARPKRDPGHAWTRSYIGVAVFRPDLSLIRRFEEPVLGPSPIVESFDGQGVEDPRITFIDGAYWMMYCGVSPREHEDPLARWLGSVCLARSTDLVDWQKCGVVKGTGDAFANANGLALVSNKDGVLFPDKIDGKYVALHRPMAGAIGTWSTSIAIADDIAGPYTDLGKVHSAKKTGGSISSWTGAGAVPIQVEDGVYLSIEHTGNFLHDGSRRYVLDAFLYDFNNWDPAHPESLVRARLDDFMRPETEYEVSGPFSDSVANVVFACGAYVRHGEITLIYGGGDSYILAARLNLNELLGAIEANSPAAQIAAGA